MIKKIQSDAGVKIQFKPGEHDGGSALDPFTGRELAVHFAKMPMLPRRCSLVLSSENLNEGTVGDGGAVCRRLGWNDASWFIIHPFISHPRSARLRRAAFYLLEQNNCRDNMKFPGNVDAGPRNV